MTLRSTTLIAFALVPLQQQADRASSNGLFTQPVDGTAIVSKYMSARSLTNFGNWRLNWLCNVGRVGSLRSAISMHVLGWPFAELLATLELCRKFMLLNLIHFSQADSVGIFSLRCTLHSVHPPVYLCCTL